MRLSIVRGGGLAGVARRTELTSEALPEDAARALEARASAVVPDAGGEAAARTPDEMLYEVCVERAEGTTTVRYTDATLPEEVRALIAWADGRPERTDAFER
jgi:hypothetical protein